MEMKSIKAHGEILFFSLYISIARCCRLRLCRVVDLSQLNACTNVYIRFLVLSCNLFILLLSVLLQNIQTNGQYENCDSKNDFINTCSFGNAKRLDILTNAVNFLPAEFNMDCI